MKKDLWLCSFVLLAGPAFAECDRTTIKWLEDHGYAPAEAMAWCLRTPVPADSPRPDRAAAPAVREKASEPAATLPVSAKIAPVGETVSGSASPAGANGAGGAPTAKTNVKSAESAQTVVTPP